MLFLNLSFSKLYCKHLNIISSLLNNSYKSKIGESILLQCAPAAQTTAACLEMNSAGCFR